MPSMPLMRTVRSGDDTRAEIIPARFSRPLSVSVSTAIAPPANTSNTTDRVEDDAEDLPQECHVSIGFQNAWPMPA